MNISEETLHNLRAKWTNRQLEYERIKGSGATDAAIAMLKTCNDELGQIIADAKAQAENR